MSDRAESGMVQAAAVTVSDKGYAGEREDRSGPILVQALEALGFRVTHTVVVPDEQGRIEVLLRDLSDRVGVDLVVTTGGTGPAPRDVTPEATRAVIQREMPGLAELVRIEGLKKTPRAVLSRGIAGIRGGTLIVNLPGSPKAVREGMEALGPVLPHALQMLRGESLEHGPTGGDSD